MYSILLVEICIVGYIAVKIALIIYVKWDIRREKLRKSKKLDKKPSTTVVTPYIKDVKPEQERLSM